MESAASDLKYFTPNSAKKTLPLVKRIVEDILREGINIRRLMPQNDSQLDNDTQLEYSFGIINNYVTELKEIGCYYKDYSFEIGLVDFPAMINGEQVFLCWKSDEDSLLYYHSIDGGFATRTLIPEELYYDE